MRFDDAGAEVAAMPRGRKEWKTHVLGRWSLSFFVTGVIELGSLSQPEQRPLSPEPPVSACVSCPAHKVLARVGQAKIHPPSDVTLFALGRPVSVISERNTLEFPWIEAQ